ARQRAYQANPAFDQAAYPVDPPFLGILARCDVLAQWRKSLGFQLFQDGSKGCCKRGAGVTDKYDLKTSCNQIAPYFFGRGEEANGGRGAPSQWVRPVHMTQRGQDPSGDALARIVPLDPILVGQLTLRPRRPLVHPATCGCLSYSRPLLLQRVCSRIS